MITVSVFRRQKRKFYQAQWTDPITGKTRTRSTKCPTHKEAIRVAARIEAEVNADSDQAVEQISWSEFRKKYTEEVLPSMAAKTGDKMNATFNAIERHINPAMLSALNARVISRFQSKLRGTGIADPTIKSHLASLKSALGWAQEQGYLATVPIVRMPQRKTGMKGRPITREEFERQRAKARDVVGAELESDWQWDLDGLWWSGFRLGEAIDLHWTDDRLLCVDLSGKFPMFRIQAEAEKGNKHRILPMAPEFAEMLLSVPEAKRDGYVFKFSGRRGGVSLEWASKQISLMGELAGIKVAEQRVTRDGRPTTRIKWASAHDFRRAFGERWAKLLMPKELMELMRHETIQTTMTFYAGRNAEDTADRVWKAFTDTSTVTSPSRRKPDSEIDSQLITPQDDIE